MGKVTCNVEEETVLPLESVFIEIFKVIELVIIKPRVPVLGRWLGSCRMVDYLGHHDWSNWHSSDNALIAQS